MSTLRARIPKLSLASTQRLPKPPDLCIPVTPIRTLTSARGVERRRFSASLPTPPSHPMTARSRRPRFNPAQMTQQIGPELQELSIEFGSLNVMTRAFFTANSILALRPELPAVWASLSLSFDTFCRQCTMTFSNANRNPSATGSHQGTPLYDYGQSLMSKWVNFIEQINELADGDIEPYRAKMEESFGGFRESIDRLAVSVKRTQLWVKRRMTVLDRLTVDAQQCESSVSEVFTAVRDPSFMGLDTHEQEEKVERLRAKAQSIFEHEIPMDAIPIRERARVSARMQQCCAEVTELLRSMAAFHGQIADIKTQIVATNREFTAIHERMHLPFSVTLSFGG